MNLTQTMKMLEQRGVASTRRIMPKHGIRGACFGVRYADFYKLRDQIKCDHGLAQQLWGTQNHDARILATMIMDPETITSRELDEWIGVADNAVLNDAIAGVAARTPHAKKKADLWRKVKGEWKSAAGWNLVAQLAAPESGAEDAWLAARLGEIKKGIHTAPNRTRHTMNLALISIGGYRPALRKRALETAGAVGRIEVDHGKTSCKTPDAAAYIRKIAQRQKKKGK